MKIILQFGSLLIIQQTRWFLCKSGWQQLFLFILVETGQQLTSQGGFFSKRGVEKLGFCRSTTTNQRCACTEVDFVIQQVNGAREEKAMRSELRTNCLLKAIKPCF